MKNLRKIRAERGLRQEDVAKAIGISRQQYVTYEKKDYMKLADEKEKKLSEFLGISLVELYGEDNLIHKPKTDEEKIFVIKLIAKRLSDKDLLKELWD